MRFARTLTVFGLALALVAGLLPSAWAQISTGSIYGKVTDEQSAVLPGATITLTGANTGARTTTLRTGRRVPLPRTSTRPPTPFPSPSRASPPRSAR